MSGTSVQKERLHIAQSILMQPEYVASTVSHFVNNGVPGPSAEVPKG